MQGGAADMAEWIRELAEHHRFKVLGLLLGLVFALLVIHFGILRTLFIVLCAGTGYWIGKRLDDEPEGLTQWIDRLLPPNMHR